MIGERTPETPRSEPQQPRAGTILLLWAACAVLLFFTFVALGSWQVQRLHWKRALIARVDQRVHATVSDIPPPQHWQDLSAQSDEYRHVQVSGQFLYEFTTRVHASTNLGRGFWLLTPLRTGSGAVIWINRGFIAFSARPGPVAASPKPETITGLLRMNEPGGTVLNHNQPDLQQWYSRDIAAMSTKYQLTNTAPFFIDASAIPSSEACNTGLCADQPVGGLTVIAFNNNHLVYSVTWFALALMVALACAMLLQTELRLRRQADPQTATDTPKIASHD